MRSDPLTLASDGEPDSGGTLDGVAGARDTIGTDVEILWGGQADDRLTGNDRDNYLWGGAGADVLSGGPGFDYADYSDRDESVTVAPDGQPDSGGTSDGPVGARDTVATDIEGIFGGYGDDRLFGSAVPNYLDAGAGDDLVDSRGGGDDVDVCGDGIDTALADPVIDDVDPTCERINPPPAATPSPTPTPSATPTVSPAAVPAPGRTAPRATFKLPRQTLAHALAHGLRLRVSCSEACRVDATMTLGARTAKTLGLAKTKRAVVVARGAAGSGGSVVVRFTAKARRRLAHVRHVTLTLVVHATDADGNRATIRRTVTLTRSRATLAAAFRWRIRGAPTAALTGR
jgi:hypothetical protein